MPKILEKRKVLNGRGIVGEFGVGTSEGKFFYREKVQGPKAYSKSDLILSKPFKKMMRE